jgi:holliday junction DNA helicase RuvA
MISAIEGIIENRYPDSVTVKVGPVSLIVHTSNNTLNQIGLSGKVYLNTHLHVREDNITLFGFNTLEELKLFEKLITVNGIGPRLALALLSAFDSEKLVKAIVSEDAALISQTPGIGKKIAARIIIDLKSKLEKEGIVGGVPVTIHENTDVISALVSLGYSVREAAQAASTLPENEKISLEEKVKTALQFLASK